jgi:hypothetical protein
MAGQAVRCLAELGRHICGTIFDTNILRNKATHANVKFSLSQATEMSRLCRVALDALR